MSKDATFVNKVKLKLEDWMKVKVVRKPIEERQVITDIKSSRELKLVS